MKIVPVGDKVVIKRLESEATTTGGIVLPGSAQQKPSEGRVLSVGQGRELLDGSRIQPQVNEGDRIVFSSYAGMEITVNDEELLIMSEEEILAVVG